jgi:cyclopropane fatty-acyl-phospholipid synthase-like methyltransferase
MLAREYHEFMLGSTADAKVRAAFQRAVLSLVRPGGTILDFGAGSGIDAKHYAGQGRRVIAYDASPDMRGYAAEYCGRRVTVLDMDYPMFLKESRSESVRADAITANFAVLNLIEDHEPLFAAFDRWLSRDGFILVNMLSPYYLGDARYRWWWRHRVRFLREGRFSVGGKEGTSHRYGLATIERAARPYFVLEGVLPSSGAATPLPALRRAVSLRTHLYMTLLFRRA